MSDIDFALAWDFLDHQGRPRQLRFRQNDAPPGDPRIVDGTGQLVAVIANGARPDNGDEVALTRPGVALADVEAAIDGWEDWATLLVADNGIDRLMNLADVQHRIDDAGLGATTPR